MKEVIKELGYVYITSDGTKFADKEKANVHQSQVNYVTESKEIIERRKVMNAEKILDILKENGWGVYYKTNPINLLGVQGGEAPIFSVNAVDENILLNALQGNKGDNKWHSETDSTQ
jgi:hypothetical protein